MNQPVSTLSGTAALEVSFPMDGAPLALGVAAPAFILQVDSCLTPLELIHDACILLRDGRISAVGGSSAFVDLEDIPRIVRPPRGKRMPRPDGQGRHLQAKTRGRVGGDQSHRVVHVFPVAHLDEWVEFMPCRCPARSRRAWLMCLDTCIVAKLYLPKTENARGEALVQQKPVARLALACRWIKLRYILIKYISYHLSIS